ncbi:MAG TPA: DUF6782 family putative metallopeptidase [Blastocatellia bacterium]|jgi:hypothetical protein|nr:DUF6782 family putative metallopeptidase [Blastocatellia bacterium]
MMQRRLTAPTALILALSLIVSAAGLTRRQAAIRDSASALDATEEVLQSVSRLRRLKPKHSVRSNLRTRDEIKESVIRDMTESTTPEEFAASEKTLAKLGLVPGDFRLRDYMVSLLREQVAGFYEPKTQEFFLAAWIPIAEQKTVIAHELTHALQDQHFNLRRFEKWPKGDSDAELAAHALIEGDATVTMILYDYDQNKGQMSLPGTDSSADDDSKYPVLAKAPAVLRESLQFPYINGAIFVQEVLKNRSWTGLNSSYDKLPASTEQIMHPEKFLQGEGPVRVETGSLLPALGGDWKLLDSDVNGEFGFQIMLSEFISKGDSRRASEGWGGDRYATYQEKTGAVMIAQYSTWDTARDAEEFFKAYCERTEKRYRSARTAPPEAGGGQGRRLYQTEEGLVMIELRGQDVVIIEGAQTREQTARLQEQLWQSKKSQAAR